MSALPLSLFVFPVWQKSGCDAKKTLAISMCDVINRPLLFLPQGLCTEVLVNVRCLLHKLPACVLQAVQCGVRVASRLPPLTSEQKSGFKKAVAMQQNFGHQHV